MLTTDRLIRRSPALARREVLRAEGNHLVAADGARVLDAVSGSMTANFGYTNPDIVTALALAAAELPYVHDSRACFAAQVELADRLARLSPLDDAHAYLTVSGSDAVEAAMRIALMAQGGRGNPERVGFAGVSGGFHGSTFAALRATGAPRVTRSYEAYLGERSLLPFPGEDAERGVTGIRELFARCGRDLAAVIVEPVVANGSGTLALPRWYVDELARQCAATGTLIIADEITTSLWRCGAAFTAPLVGLPADIVCVGKGLGVGYAAISAVLAAGQVARQAAGHGSLLGHNYNSHPIAVAAANAVLDKLDRPGFAGEVTGLGERFDAMLREVVAAARGALSFRRVGLLASVDIAGDAEAVANALWRDGELLVLPGRGALGAGRGEHLTLAPSFTTTDDDLRHTRDRLVAHLGAHPAAPVE